MSGPAPVQRRVLRIDHNPLIPSAGGKRLREVLGWNDPDQLTQQCIDDLRECSYAYAQYVVVEHVVEDDFPVKADGFAYTPDGFLQAWRSRTGFHQPDGVDYLAILRRHGVAEKVNRGEIDEVWLFGFPYAGYYESRMAGPGAFWCNAPPLTGSGARRRFVIMGFNYERGVGEMLENFGHRAESIMAEVFKGQKGDDNLWERFTRYDKTHPGQAECGNVHFAPNSLRDYDWGNRRPVFSRADSWLGFPNLSSSKGRRMTASDWGNGNIREHHLWWFRRFPHVAGAHKGIAYNWWQYVIDPNTAGIPLPDSGPPPAIPAAVESGDSGEESGPGGWLRRLLGG